MKRFYDHDVEIIAGDSREIRSLYRKLYERTGYLPLFTEDPKFNDNRIYGISIWEEQVGDSTETFFNVLGETTLVEILLGKVGEKYEM